MLRAKQSFTAIGMYRRAGELEAIPGEFARETFAGDGLLHDARNLVSAIGLYCDLLSMPGVLKPEHRKYSDELRLLGTRSEEMIENLMHSLAAQQSAQVRSDFARPLQAFAAEREIARTSQPAYRAGPVSLRAVVERCSGLLSRVANGRPIEVVYGPAADVPIRIAVESLERILVNLVRNGSAALGEEPEAIRISAGQLAQSAGEAQAWPCDRVRLMVEDAGCGMEPRQLEALLSGRGPAPRGNHGIGFRVVRELVSASNGELRAASARGIGTRIQIEWPVTESIQAGGSHGGMRMRERVDGSERNPVVVRPMARSRATGILHDRAATEERQDAH